LSTSTFQLSGSITISPAVGCPSGQFNTGICLSEMMYLSATAQDGDFSLTVDTPVVFPFGAVTNANIIFIKTSAKVKVRLTSADGATQSVPVDSLLILEAVSVPVTAIDFTRVAGTSTTVQVFIGQKA